MAETNNDKGSQEDDTSTVDVISVPKDEDESLKGSYLVMDNASIHKSKPMTRKIEARVLDPNEKNDEALLLDEGRSDIF
ncbi:hypothetical protein G6F56_004029 [Rhizopus delemar]|nr:hypothetical protein G6F56_004029 [Rhizopus delemar]